MNGRRLPSRSTQRLLARAAAGCGVLAWTLAVRPPSWPAVLLVSLGFLGFALGVWTHERTKGEDERDSDLNALPELFCAALVVAFTGGVSSEFDALFYLLLAVRAPFATFSWSIALPALATFAYAAAVLPVWQEEGFGRVAVHTGAFWVIALLLRGISARAREEREMAQRFASTLSTTHEEVRRYTAALERANADSERRLAQITLLHRFLHDARKERGIEAVYQTVLSYLGQAGEAPWIVLTHRSEPVEGEPILRTWGDPPDALKEWGARMGRVEGNWSDGARDSIQGEGGPITVQVFSRCSEEGSAVLAVLGYPAGHPPLEKSQAQTMSALMDSVALELELVRLEADLNAANAQLRESNRHLVRLQELQAELSRAFLDTERTEDVIHGIQEIMAKEIFELDRLNLFLPDPGTGMLRCRTSVGIGTYPMDQIHVPMDERGGAISLAFREGRTIFFDGKGPVPAEFRISYPYSQIPAVRSRNFVVVPIVEPTGTVLGVIGADRKYSLRPIPPQTVTMLEFFARHLAMVLSARMIRDGRPMAP